MRTGARREGRWIAPAMLGLSLAGMAAVSPPLSGQAPALHWGALGLRGTGVVSLAPAASGAGIVWALVFGDGVWKSLDGGVSWNQQQLAPRDGYFAVVADPVDPLTVYAYGNAGLAKSADGGIAWQTILASPVQAFAVAPSAAGVLYVAGASGLGQGGAISRSDDGGATWKPVTSLAPPLEGPYRLTVDPTDPNDVYGLAASFHLDSTPLVVRTVDGGLTWNPTGPLPGGFSVLIVDPRQPATLYAADDRLLVVRSLDHGATWEPANSGLPAADFAGPLAFDPASGSLFVATFVLGRPFPARIWKSADGGGSWSLVLERDGDRFEALAADPALPGRLYAASDGASLLASGDGGAHWQVANPGFTPAAIDDVALAAGEPGRIYAAAHTLQPLGVERSSDSGVTWQAANQGLQGYAAPLAVARLVADRASAGVLYALAGEGFFATKDGGQSWQSAGSSLPFALPLDVAAGPAAGELFAAGVVDETLPFPENAVVRSLDGGVHWTPVLVVTAAGGVRPDRPSSVLVDFAVFAGGRGGLWKSHDGGQSWTPIGIGLPADQAIVRLRTDAAHRLYAVLEPGAHQLFRSADRGATWTAAEGGLPAGTPVADLAADPAGTALYAGTGAGVYVSVDGGTHWTARNDGLGDLRVTRLLADPAHPGVVYAGTAGGLYVSPAPARPCQASDSVLCLAGGRFAAQIAWTAPGGAGGSGHAEPLTAASGGFWFFTPESSELAVKLVDGRLVNGRFWVFVAGVSDLAYTLTVTDTVTGVRRVYTNPQGRLASFADTGAFAAAAAAAAAADGAAGGVPAAGGQAGAGQATVLLRRAPAPAPAPTAGAGPACVPAAANLCLAGSRFAVQISWNLPGGAATAARALPLSVETGVFWFLAPQSLEIVVKIVDGRQLNGHYWVFVAGLSSLAYAATVTDTATGESRTYVHRAGSLASLADTSF